MDISATRRKASAFDRRYWLGKLWPRWSWRVEQLNWNARYLAWLDEHQPRIFDTRAAMYEHLCPDGPITYLEFGVYKGESLKTWLQLNRHEDSRFHGFDSWEGLAGEEGAPFDKGHFATEPPVINDARCTLHRGWFEQTLPLFIEAEHDCPGQLIINLDADEYVPTMQALIGLRGYIEPGTIVMFDEMSVAQCEFRALLDWAAIFGREYRVIAGWKHGQRVEGVAIEVTR